jgi:hypothetical protein
MLNFSSTSFLEIYLFLPLDLQSWFNTTSKGLAQGHVGHSLLE